MKAAVLKKGKNKTERLLINSSKQEHQFLANFSLHQWKNSDKLEYFLCHYTIADPVLAP